MRCPLCQTSLPEKSATKKVGKSLKEKRSAKKLKKAEGGTTPFPTPGR
jgi:hypothetical protein